MNNTEPTNGEAEEHPIIVLDDTYRSAFLGHTLCPIEHPRAVYSLPLLAKLEARRLASDEETAQKSIISMMRQIYQEHGNRAPRS